MLLPGESPPLIFSVYALAICHVMKAGIISCKSVRVSRPMDRSR